VSVQGEGGTGRRRRTPDAARREILQAAEELLRERPFRELTVDEVMRRTGLSRPSFYVYFKDRHELALHLLAEIESEVLAGSSRWYESAGEGPATLREALEGLVATYARHGPVMRALADASVDDPGVEAAWQTVFNRYIGTTADHIQQEIDAGTIRPIDATETAKALTWMTERYLYHSFGPAQRVSAARLHQTLSELWTRALYQSL